MAEGFLHEFQGWAVFMICTGLMLAEIAALNRVGRESGSFRELFGFELPTPTPQDGVTRSRHVPPSFLAATACLVVVVLGTFGMARPAEIFPARAALDSFPMQLGVWKGRRETLEGVYADALNLDDYLMADYVDPSGAAVNLYIPYYNSQRKGEAVHSPRSCLPGGGWQMRDFDQRSLPGVAIGGQPLRVNRAIVEMGNQRQLVYYWFQQRGRIITNEFAVKWYLFWDALTRHRTDGGMVRLVAAIPPGSSEAEADQHVVAIAALLAPRLSQYIPD
jgi:EpsI family protein